MHTHLVTAHYKPFEDSPWVPIRNARRRFNNLASAKAYMAELKEAFPDARLRLEQLQPSI